MKSGEELRAKGRERTNRWRARRRERSEWAFKKANREYQQRWRAKKVAGDVKEEDKDGRIRGRGTSDKGQIDGVAEGKGAGEDIGACGIAAGDEDSWDRVRDGGERGSGDSAQSEEGLKLIRYASEVERREAFRVLKAAIEGDGDGVEVEGW